MLFADVRGSTELAERLGTSEFRRLMNRFYAAGTEVLARSDAIVERFQGDQVVGYYVPLSAGGAHARRAVEAARELMRVVGYGEASGAWIPVGVGVNTGHAFMGTVGRNEGMVELTALGDPVNVAARFAAAAGPGEILVGERTLEVCGLGSALLETRELELKGKTAPVRAGVLRATYTTLRRARVGGRHDQ